MIYRGGGCWSRADGSVTRKAALCLFAHLFLLTFANLSRALSFISPFHCLLSPFHGSFRVYLRHRSIIKTRRAHLEVASRQVRIHPPLPSTPPPLLFPPICSRIPFCSRLPHISSVLYLSFARWAVCSPSFFNFSNGRIDNCCFAAFPRCENTNDTLDKSVCAPESARTQAYAPNTRARTLQPAPFVSMSASSPTLSTWKIRDISLCSRCLCLRLSSASLVTSPSLHPAQALPIFFSLSPPPNDTHIFLCLLILCLSPAEPLHLPVFGFYFSLLWLVSVVKVPHELDFLGS